MKFKIYENYGVLGAEKKVKYTYGAEHPHAVVSEEINVTLPQNEFFEICENGWGELFVKSSWGWNYEINDVLQGNEKPCFYAVDKNDRGHRIYLIRE